MNANTTAAIASIARVIFHTLAVYQFLWYSVNMAFGAEYGKVIASVECPRCGAPAKLRGKKKESSRRLETSIVCEKCHLSKFNGFVKIDTIALAKLKKTLERKRSRATSDDRRSRIDRRLDEVEEKGRYSDLGL